MRPERPFLVDRLDAPPRPPPPAPPGARSGGQRPSRAIRSLPSSIIAPSRPRRPGAGGIPGRVRAGPSALLPRLHHRLVPLDRLDLGEDAVASPARTLRSGGPLRRPLPLRPYLRAVERARILIAIAGSNGTVLLLDPRRPRLARPAQQRVGVGRPALDRGPRPPRPAPPRSRARRPAICAPLVDRARAGSRPPGRRRRNCRSPRSRARKSSSISCVQCPSRARADLHPPARVAPEHRLRPARLALAPGPEEPAQRLRVGRKPLLRPHPRRRLDGRRRRPPPAPAPRPRPRRPAASTYTSIGGRERALRPPQPLVRLGRRFGRPPPELRMRASSGC